MQQVEPVEIVIKELWTNKQRQMSSIHYTVSYRGSFKPELPAFFIEKYTPKRGELWQFFSNDKNTSKQIPIIFDPFAGRGTTAIQANIMCYIAWANDINPMLERILYPLTHFVSVYELEERLKGIDWNLVSFESLSSDELDKLVPFYHTNTITQLLSLKEHLKENRDDVDRCIEVIALSRLHGHSKGFFSAYSFPQISVPPNRQRLINKRHEMPVAKNVPELIVRKYKRSISGDKIKLLNLKKYGKLNQISHFDAASLPRKVYPDESVDLIVTSPPFLAQVDYLSDNWLEFWFLDIDETEFSNKLVQTPNLENWKDFITKSLLEMHRVLKTQAKCVIEVGDVTHNKKKINLDDIVTEIGKKVGFGVHKRYINEQQFTKLSNCFKVENNKKGVNTNRMVVFRKI